jgi:hypothetical protein
MYRRLVKGENMEDGMSANKDSSKGAYVSAVSDSRLVQFARSMRLPGEIHRHRRGRHYVCRGTSLPALDTN